MYSLYSWLACLYITDLLVFVTIWSVEDDEGDLLITDESFLILYTVLNVSGGKSVIK